MPCYHMSMAKRKKPDVAETARRIVEQAIGEQLNGEPLREPEPESKKAAAGRKGGKSRADKLTDEERRKSAQKAARARWSK